MLGCVTLFFFTYFHYLKIWGNGGGGSLFSPDGVAPSRMVIVSASVNIPLHHKVQKFSLGTGLPGWSRKKGRKTFVVSLLMSEEWRWPHQVLFVMFIVRNLFILTKVQHV